MKIATSGEQDREGVARAGGGGEGGACIPLAESQKVPRKKHKKETTQAKSQVETHGSEEVTLNWFGGNVFVGAMDASSTAAAACGAAQTKLLRSIFSDPTFPPDYSAYDMAVERLSGWSARA